MEKEKLENPTSSSSFTSSSSSSSPPPPPPSVATSSSESHASGEPQETKKQPLVIVVIGMAGSGKTTFVKSFYEHLKRANKKVYSINLDPAVINVPYPTNIDICDTIKYKEVMKHYQLGPNGAIMTSLNLFATQFDKVLNLLEKRAPKLDYVIIDTPGQIEVFNWSASGTIILDSLATTFPTTVAYVVDTVRCSRAITFMSNMMYACSVLYKTRLPFVLCFNKIDVVSHKQCIEWMSDYESYQDAVMEDSTYMASLSRSCALLLYEFYKEIRSVGVSAATGQGYNALQRTLEGCAHEYQTEFIPWVEKRREEIKKRRQREEAQEMRRIKKDLHTTPNLSSAGKTHKKEEQSLHEKESVRKDEEISKKMSQMKL